MPEGSKKLSRAQSGRFTGTVTFFACCLASAEELRNILIDIHLEVVAGVGFEPTTFRL